MADDTDSDSTLRKSPVQENLPSTFLQLAQQHHYDFRLTTRLTKRPISTWIDTDDSGTYDPKCRGNTVPPRKRTRGGLKDVNKDVKNNEAREEPSITSPRLQSEEQREPPAIESANGEQAESIENAAKTADQTDTNQAPSKLPNFPKLKPLSYDDLFGTQQYSTRAQGRSPQILENRSLYSTPLKSAPALDLFVPPTRSKPKGCKACFNSGISCPLKRDGSRYPCYHCVRKDRDCNLITSPPRKQPCEGCRKVRERCSYREGSDSSLPCNNCTRKGQECVAGSRNSSGFKPTLERPFFSCKPCREKRGRCSLRTKDTRFSCKNCLKDGLNCSFERLGNEEVEVESEKAEIPQEKRTAVASEKRTAVASEKRTAVASEKRTAVASEKRTAVASEKRTTVASEKRTAVASEKRTTVASEKQTAVASENYTVKNIETSFAHPITFNHTPDEDGNDPCHWCDAIAFGIIGHGPVEVEVIDRHDGQGYTEVSGGHVSQGEEPSRMCEICTMDRVMICTCEDHAIHPIPGRNPRNFDFEAALEQLLAPTSALDTANRALWCSICPSPAFFECLTPQVLDTPGDDDNPTNGGGGGGGGGDGSGGAPPTTSGCGLLLCESCEQLLTHTYKGDLPAMLANALVQHPANFPAGLRADAGFLSCDGELMLRLMAAEREKAG